VPPLPAARPFSRSQRTSDHPPNESKDAIVSLNQLGRMLGIPLAVPSHFSMQNVSFRNLARKIHN
jgi:hypothetical protein